MYIYEGSILETSKTYSSVANYSISSTSLVFPFHATFLLQISSGSLHLNIKPFCYQLSIPSMLVALSPFFSTFALFCPISKLNSAVSSSLCRK